MFLVVAIMFCYQVRQAKSRLIRSDDTERDMITNEIK